MQPSSPDAAVPAPQDRLIGTVISDSYQIEALLGEGGMGKVYAARHLRLPRKAAVKVLQPELAREPDLLKRFQREAEIASSLGSRHIVQVFDFGMLPGGSPYILMEFLQGKDLDARLAEKGTLHPNEVVELFDQAVAGLSTAHASKVIHRDIKPANLFLARDGDGTTVLKILDFGLSKIRGGSLSLSGTNAVGTPAYMSPEQLRADAEVDQRTDVYALGVTLYELLTGVRPFDDPSVTRLCEHILSDPPPLASARRQNLTPEIDAVIVRALAKEVADRYATAAEFWSAARPALLVCAARMRTVEMAVTPVPRPLAQVQPGIAQTFISGPRSPQSDAGPTANLRPSPDQVATQLEPAPELSSQEQLAVSRPSRLWMVLVPLALAAVAAVWMLARPKPAPSAHAVPRALAPVAAAHPEPAPTAAPPPAPAAVKATPAPSSAIAAPAASKPSATPAHRARKKSGQPDGLLGADSIDN